LGRAANTVALWNIFEMAPKPRERPMNIPADSRAPRILIVDDNAAIHQDFRKILTANSTPGHDQLDYLEAELFGKSPEVSTRIEFRVESALQGQAALEMIQTARDSRDPYVLAFVDIRMPPGWDGIETIEQLWKCDPELQAVLCTAYSDYSWDDITRRLGYRDGLLILKKPFDAAEVLQAAHALARKWELARQAQLHVQDLERMVAERTRKLQDEMEQNARMQEALRISEDRFSKAFQNCPIPMAIQSHPAALFLDVNPSFVELSGYSRDELLQASSLDLGLWEPGVVPDEKCEASKLRVKNRASSLCRRDGAIRNTMVWTEPIALEVGACLLVIMEDMSEHLQLEAQLRQSQKLEAVGCLAAGVAHEFNNLLTVIQGHTGLLKGKVPSPGPAFDSVERIGKAAHRAASLTRRLLAFSHKQSLQLKAVNLSSLVESVGKTLSQLIGERFVVELECDANLPATRADEGNLEQILINLALNARDAMGTGGTLRVTTSAVVVTEAAARQNVDARPGNYVCLTVTDTGCGMTQEVMGRIFDPFYTTKEIGKGTGLGLSTVHGIVKQHHGWIDVSSQLNCGTMFKVYFPVWEDAPLPEAAAELESDRQVLSGAGETIMIVEDEGIVREAARMALERAGYTVIEAADGPEALALWDRSLVRIDLLVTDMVMPHGVSGGALARLLQARDPHLKALYTSGYSSDVVKEDLRLTFGTSFLRKPYSPAALLDAVQECLTVKACRAEQADASPADCAAPVAAS
jgi:PAS domain S-box-containing protein